MNNYIVYEKKDCTNCNQRGEFDCGPGVWVKCSVCEGDGIELKEVSLKDAILDALMTDEMFKIRVSSLTWTI